MCGAAVLSQWLLALTSLQQLVWSLMFAGYITRLDGGAMTALVSLLLIAEAHQP